jgi:hypothetical protein
MQYVYNDGGRAAAGYKGRASDCVTRAIAIATGTDYQTVYDAINQAGKTERQVKGRRSTARQGVYKRTQRRFLAGLNWTWVPTMHIGQGCKVHLRKEELPSGKLIVAVSRHMTTVIDGVIHDTHDPSRGGTRCVYGYYHKPQNPA